VWYESDALTWITYPTWEEDDLKQIGGAPVKVIKVYS